MPARRQTRDSVSCPPGAVRALALALCLGLGAAGAGAEPAGPYLVARQALMGNDFPAASDALARALVGDPGNMQLADAAVAAALGEGRIARAAEVAARMDAAGAVTPQGALARVVAQGTGRPTIRDLDELAARFVVVPPELELVAARRSLEAFGDLPQEGRRGGEAENLLRDALRRIELALASVPSSADARAVAVLAHLFMSESFGLDPDAASRFRGHLSWLLASGPKTHVQRPVWEQLARDAGR